MFDNRRIFFLEMKILFLYNYFNYILGGAFYMADVYFYIDKNILTNTLRYGMKLSQNYHSEVFIDTVLKKCMFGVLNPKDDLIKWNSTDCSCIRAELKNEYLFITDSIFINTNHFEKSLIPINEYKFGTYKTPIVITLCSILPEQLHTVNKYIDVPVLYESSKDLYYKNIIECLKEEISHSDEIIINALLNEYVKTNSLEEITLNNNVKIYKNKFGYIFY